MAGLNKPRGLRDQERPAEGVIPPPAWGSRSAGCLPLALGGRGLPRLAIGQLAVACRWATISRSLCLRILPEGLRGIDPVMTSCGILYLVRRSLRNARTSS